MLLLLFFFLIVETIDLKLYYFSKFQNKTIAIDWTRVCQLKRCLEKWTFFAAQFSILIFHFSAGRLCLWARAQQHRIQTVVGRSRKEMQFQFVRVANECMRCVCKCSRCVIPTTKKWQCLELNSAFFSKLYFHFGWGWNQKQIKKTDAGIKSIDGFYLEIVQCVLRLHMSGTADEA